MVPDVPVAGLNDRIRSLLDKACEKEICLATAESCTGGLLASLLTDVRGVSHAFDRGFVTYSEDAKVDQLGVPRKLIEEHGAVSEQVARAMAEGTIAHSSAHLALSITGFAGPGGDDAEEGLVHIACAQMDGPTRHVVRHFGEIGRDAVRARAVEMAVHMLEAAIEFHGRRAD